MLCTSPDPLGAHPVSYTMGTETFFLEVKWPGRVVDHQPPYSSEVKERVQLYIYSSSESSRLVQGRNLFLFIFTCPVMNK
jgi:hypothetical protein